MKIHPVDPSFNTPVAVANTNQNSQRWCEILQLLATLLFWPAVIVLLAQLMIYQPYVRTHITDPPKLKIDSLTASNFTLSSRPNQVYADWNVKMNLETKNSHGYLSFSNITLSIYYNALQAGLTNVVPFTVVPLNSTVIFDVKFTGSSGLAYDSIINQINGSIADAGTLIVDVMFEALIKKSFEGRWTDYLQLVMHCKDIKLYFGYSDNSRAQMLNPPHKCKVVDQP